ncbi:MAG: hypothetical protein ACXVCO_13520 [Ktedonobacterales bacterium]
MMAGELHSGEQIVREGGAWQAGINGLISASLPVSTSAWNELQDHMLTTA